MKTAVVIKAKDTLNPRQERFAQLYASDQEYFANGVQSYIEAYQPDQSSKNWYKTACAAASRLLSNVKVYERINELLELRGLNDAFVDKQLEFLISQHGNLNYKLRAIVEYNKLKNRVLQRPEDIDTRNSDRYSEMSDEELENKIQEYYAQRYILTRKSS